MTKLKTFSALLVLIIANGFVFAGVAWNRSGEPTGELSFNQCEFRSLDRTTWRKSGRYLRLSPVSMEIDKNVIDTLRGDDVKVGMGRKWKKQHHYVILKNGGPEWQEYVRWASAKYYKNWKPPYQKLILVDGGEDPVTLLKKYMDGNSRAVMAGYISPTHRWSVVANSVAIESQYRAVFDEIRRARQLLKDKARATAKEKGEKYAAPPCIPSHRITIKWGQRYEPWINSVDAMS